MEKPDCIYSIVIKDAGINKDWSFLINLYAPIIGPEATALYFSLVNEGQILRQLNYPKFEINRLYQLTSMDAAKFNANIKKLEGLKLLKSKVAKNQSLKRFELFAPLEPSEFFANDLFEKTLAHKIGLENLEALKFIFKEKSESELFEEDFEDVTAVFEDVFPNELRETAQTKMVEEPDFNHLQGSKRTLFEKMFNLNIVNQKLKKAQVKVNYNSQKNKKAFNWALSLYNFKEDEFASLIINNYDSNRQSLDYQQFEKAVQNFISQQRQKILANSETIQESQNYVPELQPTTLDEPLNQWFWEHCQEAPNFHFIQLAQNLKTKYRFQNSTIIELFNFSWTVNEKKIIPNYLYKIAETLNKYQIQEPQAILNYLREMKIKKLYPSQTTLNFASENHYAKGGIISQEDMVKLRAKI